MRQASKTAWLAIPFVVLILGGLTNLCWGADGGRRFAHSDSDKRYLHHIVLYDINNRKITPDSDQPYSPKNTCGRCHDYETISHGWHFNAFRSHTLRAASTNSSDDSANLEDSERTNAADSSHERVTDGRPGEPWIWTDSRTGTQLPLSYRNWPGRFNPDAIGITELEMVRHFGGRLPGGGMGSQDERPSAETTDADSTDEVPPSRWQLTGDLEVDCMVCHAVSGAYDFELRRDTIGSENFAWAPTAALRLGEIDGSVARIKEGTDPDDPRTQSKIPKVKYDANRFGPDGSVFMDLVRHVENNACYQCHSQRTVGDDGIESRFIHDNDVHLRAGMNCTDCHRNGIDHQIARGFEGEQHPESFASMTTLNCVGCHLGTDFYLDEEDRENSITQLEITNRPGRLGAPLPDHDGLPPLHFEKLTCTACHSGPVPSSSAAGLMTSLAHGLGEKAHRTGEELPSIRGPLFIPEDSSHPAAMHDSTGDQDSSDNHAGSSDSRPSGPDARVTVARGMWPAYWGEMLDGNVRPLSPEKVYAATRRSLRVRRGFIEEISKPKLSSRDLVELLGEERGKVDPSEYTAEERDQVDALQLKEGEALFDEKVAASLEAIQEELDVQQAVYVSTGTVYALAEPEPAETNDAEEEPNPKKATTTDNEADAPNRLRTVSVGNPDAVSMVSWPMAHNVRPAGWSLGATGCLECHADESVLFASTVTPVGPAPAVGTAVTMASLQGIDEADRLLWNQMFGGRKWYKLLVAGSLVVLGVMMLLGLAAAANRRGGLATGSLATSERTS
ncbi:hypothetical protein [Rhodopirellula sallentina]|uniref:Signal peptide protein n=1 Tax=Rhodopirellula sallentina SM41 TaxID=1263870 RepID=M5U4C5_9BACT|nr:hypothetical protein [Rhodopirellula sallentina]EMI56307.1 signal peptide protein [Rhodopirellula sallentina SM41]